MRQPGYILRQCAVHFHYLNDRAVVCLPPVGASIARPSGGCRKAIRIRIERIFIASARYILRMFSVHFNFLNDRAVVCLPPVGAAIGRPLSPYGRSALKTVHICSASTADGQWPPLQCYSVIKSAGAKIIIAIVTGRADAIKATRSVNPNRPSGRSRSGTGEERTSNARPYNKRCAYSPNDVTENAGAERSFPLSSVGNRQ